MSGMWSTTAQTGTRVAGSAPGRARSGLGEFTDRLAGALVGAAEELLRTHGLCPPPAVHLLRADANPPYLGMLTCRPFYRGADAATAVASMSALATAAGATDLVLVWEHCDMCTALELPRESFPSGIVVVEASLRETSPDRGGSVGAADPAGGGARGGHVVGWYPYLTRFGPPGPSGMPTVDPEWGTPQRVPGGWLPEPVAELLSTWRTTITDQLDGAGRADGVAARMEAAGYRIRWVAR